MNSRNLSFFGAATSFVMAFLTSVVILLGGPLSLGCARGAEPEKAISTDQVQKVSIASDQVAVAGLSAGGYLAVQLGVAYSSVFSGVGSFAAGPYNCAEGMLLGALTCGTHPEAINPSYLVEQTIAAQALGSIDPTSKIGNQKVYLYAGSGDRTVLPLNLEKTKEYYETFNAQIKTKLLEGAGHGMPTSSYGVVCKETQTPWISNCSYDGAGEAMNWFWPGLEAGGQNVEDHLYVFNQKSFGTQRAELSDTGFVYIPKSCELSGETQTACKLLVALHGCDQSVPQLGSEFSRHSGFNEWAENNGVVVLYPSTRPTKANPLGCWDWWGYTGADYAAKSGAQMSAIVEMVHSLEGR